jgi:hypothetical protein
MMMVAAITTAAVAAAALQDIPCIPGNIYNVLIHNGNVGLLCLSKGNFRKMEVLKCHTFRLVVLLELFFTINEINSLHASDGKPCNTIKLYVSAIISRRLFETVMNLLE